MDLKWELALPLGTDKMYSSSGLCWMMAHRFDVWSAIGLVEWSVSYCSWQAKSLPRYSQPNLGKQCEQSFPLSRTASAVPFDGQKSKEPRSGIFLPVRLRLFLAMRREPLARDSCDTEGWLPTWQRLCHGVPDSKPLSFQPALQDAPILHRSPPKPCCTLP